MRYLFIKVLASLFLFLLLADGSFLGREPIVSVAYASMYANDEIWTEPINLSHSGSTSNSQLIIDSSGHFHALWVDEFDGYIASSSIDGVSWSTPVSVNLPFSTKDGTPTFVADSDGYIHAFWNDNANGLFYSRVIAENFTSGQAWEDRQQIAGSAVSFNVAMDDQGIIHLAYIRILSTQDSPSGVYYRTSRDNGVNWSTSKVLYQSQYFRSLKTGEANVKISTSGDGSIYVVWDNRQLKLILFSKSIDGGNSWIEPKILRGPNIEDGNNIPFGINIAVNEKGMLIIWDLGLPNANCDQFSQWSTDDGDSWSNPLLISQYNYGCSPASNLFNLNEGSILFNIYMEGQPTLIAWNGIQWSNRQKILTSFIDPDTKNSIDYHVQQTVVTGDARLFVIGYDEDGTGDTWLASRSLESISDWFPDPAKWSKPNVIYASSAEISLFSIAVDGLNQFHLFWIQNDLANGVETSSILYSKWEGVQWTQPQAIYTANQSKISQLDTAVYNERLMVVWSEGPKDQILYSWSNINTAQNSTEWSAPFQLSTSLVSGESPRILAGPTGEIFVSYTKPINEGRGIYIVKSVDEGRNWSDPILVFNAEAAGWDIADSPEMATTQDGSINVIWARKSFPENGLILALYTSRSEDHGLTWTDPEVVEEGDLTFGQISGISSTSIYRIWQEVDSSTLLVNWYQVSGDGGVSWSLPTSVTDPEPNQGSPITTTDSAGRLYLFQPIQITPQTAGIAFRIWDTDGWLVGDRLIINNNGRYVPDSAAAAITPSGNLILTYLEEESNLSTGVITSTLFYESQMVNVPAVTPSTVITPAAVHEPTQAVIVPTTTTISLAPEITPTVITDSVNNTGGASKNYPVIALLLGVTVVIGIGVAFAIYYIVSNRRLN